MGYKTPLNECYFLDSGSNLSSMFGFSIWVIFLLETTKSWWECGAKLAPHHTLDSQMGHLVHLTDDVGHDRGRITFL